MASNTERAQSALDIICWIWIVWESLSIDILIPSIHLFQLNGMATGGGKGGVGWWAEVGLTWDLIINVQVILQYLVSQQLD